MQQVSLIRHGAGAVDADGGLVAGRNQLLHALMPYLPGIRGVRNAYAQLLSQKLVAKGKFRDRVIVCQPRCSGRESVCAPMVTSLLAATSRSMSQVDGRRRCPPRASPRKRRVLAIDKTDGHIKRGPRAPVGDACKSSRMHRRRSACTGPDPPISCAVAPVMSDRARRPSPYPPARPSARRTRMRQI